MNHHRKQYWPNFTPFFNFCTGRRRRSKVEEDDSEEEQLSGNAEQSKIDDAGFSHNEIMQDVDAAQEFEVEAEISQKESREDSPSPVELVIVERGERTDLKEYEEHEKHKEEEKLAVAHPELEIINEHDERDEHKRLAPTE